MSGRRRVRRPVHREHDGDRCEFLGIAALGSGSVPATDPAKHDVARATGERVMDLVRQRRASARHPDARGVRERDRGGGGDGRIDQRGAAPAGDRAAKRGVELSLADFDRISARVPLIADLKPSGRFVATDLHAAGGSALVAQRLAAVQLLASARRRSPAARSADEAALARETPGQQVVVRRGSVAQADRRARDRVRQPRARRRRREGVGHRAAAASRPGARVRQRGGGVRRRPASADPRRRRRRDSQRRAERRPRHARDAGGDGRDRRRGARRFGRARSPTAGSPARRAA